MREMRGEREREKERAEWLGSQSSSGEGELYPTVPGSLSQPALLLFFRMSEHLLLCLLKVLRHRMGRMGRMVMRE